MGRLLKILLQGNKKNLLFHFSLSKIASTIHYRYFSPTLFPISIPILSSIYLEKLILSKYTPSFPTTNKTLHPLPSSIPISISLSLSSSPCTLTSILLLLHFNLFLLWGFLPSLSLPPSSVVSFGGFGGVLFLLSGFLSVSCNCNLTREGEYKQLKWGNS